MSKLFKFSSILFAVLFTFQHNCNAERSVLINVQSAKTVLALNMPGNYACRATQPKNRFGVLFLRRGKVYFATRDYKAIRKVNSVKLKSLFRQLKSAQSSRNTPVVKVTGVKIARLKKLIRALSDFYKLCPLYSVNSCLAVDQNGICTSSTIGVNNGQPGGNSSSGNSNSTPTPTPVPGLASFNINDIAVSDNGHVVAIGTDGNGIRSLDLKVACFNNNLSSKLADFVLHHEEIQTSGASYLKYENPMVSLSRTTGRAAILFPIRKTLLAPMYRDLLSYYRIAFVDENCNVRAAPIILGNYFGDPYHDMSSNDEGSVAVVLDDIQSNGASSAKLILFTSSGDLVRNIDLTGCGASGNYGKHVALNSGGGWGVVSCQGHFYDPIRYRRFDLNGNWIDANYISVSETLNDHSSFYDSHQIGITDTGNMVMVWQDAYDGMMNTAINQTVTKMKSLSDANTPVVELGRVSGIDYDGYRGRHTPMVGLFNDNILPIGGSSGVVGLARIDGQGNFKSILSSEEVRSEILNFTPLVALSTFKATRNGDYFIASGARIYKNENLGNASQVLLGQ